VLTKVKVGELEYIFPNKETNIIILKIIEQNQAIVDMNKTLVESLAKPLFYIPPNNVLKEDTL